MATTVEEMIEKVIESDDLVHEPLKPVEWLVMRKLYEKDRQHASDLARSVGRAATSFTPILDKIQDKGFIERKKDPSDRRAVYICLTKYGRDRRDKTLAEARRLRTLINALWDQEDLADLQRIIRQVLDR